ncbi:Geranylgeranylglyceryl phosphate synthase [subsurface metagenome]
MSFKQGSSVYRYCMDVKERHGAGFFVLIDPDRTSQDKVTDHAQRCQDSGVDAILIGTSLMMGDGFDEYVDAARQNIDIPIILFPGNKSQVTGKADAILFLSLFSGRNPELIIGEQVKSAPLIRSIELEAISTAYLLIESGRLTSVEYMLNTKPIPSDKPEITVAHAMTAEMFGMKMVYLEAGSGAARPVPVDMIRDVVSAVSIPVIAGGGIRSPETVKEIVNAGASFVVVGNHLEKSDNLCDLKSFVQAAHFK